MGNKSSSCFDRVILVDALILICIGIVAISSASIMESIMKYGDSMYQVKKHLISVVMSLVLAFFSLTIQTDFYKKACPYLFIITIVLMVITYFFGREINGARRWLSLGFMNAQPSEFLKLFWILYFSSYVSKRVKKLSDPFKKFLSDFSVIPAVFIGSMLGLCYLQSDLGSATVILVISTAVLFAAGLGLNKVFGFGIIGAAVFALFVLPSDYRMKRITAFLDPWQDSQGSGYQLTQSLMAYGRGGLFGEGLGNSYQKLGYIPEAHTDFITAVIGEELGFVGVVVLIALELILVYKAISIAYRILENNVCFEGYVALGIGIWFSLQTFINVGAATAAIPTKGLTLPLVSYGGSSLMVCSIAVAILLRIDYQWKLGLIGENKIDGA